jgi:peptide/nickel transport system substrate-binding protein
VAFVSGNAIAQELRIGLGADVSAIDPHFLNQTSNNNVAEHIFDKLVQLDADSKLVPGLATSWRAVDEVTWEFKLRRGVKFHDGSELTAEDVLFSLDRPATIKNSPGPFTLFTRAITGKRAPDAYTIILTTARPYPLLANDLTQVYIVSRKVAENASTDDFNLGKAAIGTGPFKLVRFVKGERVELARNDGYWGEKPSWAKVTLRVLPNDGTRTAALLAGDVDAIENVPPQDLARVRGTTSLRTTDKVSHRVIFLHIDHRETSPFVTDKAGRPLDRNPLRDPKVRQAMSKLINRDALVERVMQGLAAPSAQFVPSTLFGYAPSIKPDAFDPEGARKLLTEAGYPDGFGLTIHGPNNRYVNDEQIAQAVGQMLARGGIATKVEVMPMATYVGRGSKKELSAGLLGWGSATGESSGALRALISTSDKEKGLGGFNWGTYSNPKFDGLVAQAMSTIDNPQRERLLQQATAMALGDYALITLYQQVSSWAMKRDLSYVARTDELTLAHHFWSQR